MLQVRPGIAGPSTLGYMNEAEILAEAVDAEAHYVDFVLHDRVRLDLRYLEERSFWYDVRLPCVRSSRSRTRRPPAAGARVFDGLSFRCRCGDRMAVAGPDLMSGVGGRA
jgi:hypothetical protein